METSSRATGVARRMQARIRLHADAGVGCRTSPTGQVAAGVQEQVARTPRIESVRWGPGGAITPSPAFGTTLNRTDYQFCIYAQWRLGLRARSFRRAALADQASVEGECQGFPVHGPRTARGVTQLYAEKRAGWRAMARSAEGQGPVNVDLSGDAAVTQRYGAVMQIRNATLLPGKPPTGVPASKNDGVQFLQRQKVIDTLF